MPKLKKALGLWGVFCIASGAMISSGLFILPGIAFAKAGPAVVLSYALAGLLMIPTMLSQAELATAMPRSGGSYFFIERSLGPLAGTLAGLANWLSITLKAAFALVGIGALAAALASALAGGDGAWDWLLKAVAIFACAGFAAVNLFSVRSVGRLQIYLVVGLLAIIVLYVVVGVSSVQPRRFEGFMPAGWPSVFAVAGMVFVSYGGLTKVVDVSEEVRSARRNLPLGMFLAFAVVNVLYVLVVFVTVGVVAPEELGGSSVPLTLGARQFLGPAGAVVISLGALLAFATTANAGILSASRSPMAMSRDGLLPRLLSFTSRRWHTPVISVAITAGFAVLAIALLSLEDLAKTASTMMILMFVLVNVAVIIMRSSGIQSYRPAFRAPLYPWLQLGAIGVYGFLIVEMGLIPLLLTGAFAVAASLWYAFYVRPRSSRESALVYMVRSVVAKEIYRSELEEELRDIALERDEIVHDRFDHLIKDCEILDLPERTTAEEMFARAADMLAGRLPVERDALLAKFRAREAESSTVVQPGIALPHVIIEGEKLFDILLVRCREGVVFREDTPPVRTAFILVGTQDERNYHLRALMAIAHIVQEHGFEERWLTAPSAENLRDIFLLSGRQRDAEG